MDMSICCQGSEPTILSRTSQGYWSNRPASILPAVCFRLFAWECSKETMSFAMLTPWWPKNVWVQSRTNRCRLCPYCRYLTEQQQPKAFEWNQWRNEPKHLGGHNLCEGAKRPSPRERGEGVGGGCPPPTVGSFFIFRLENVQSGAYLRRKFRLDDMCYMGTRVTIRPTGKMVFF